MLNGNSVDPALFLATATVKKAEPKETGAGKPPAAKPAG
jgi:hypothetical protein